MQVVHKSLFRRRGTESTVRTLCGLTTKDLGSKHALDTYTLLWTLLYSSPIQVTCEACILLMFAEEAEKSQT
jgi:hypothetical protein